MTDAAFDNLTVTGTSDLAGNTSIRGDLTVGDISIGLLRNLDVNGAATLKSLSVADALSVGGALSVAGATTLGNLTTNPGRPTSLGGTLSVSGATSLSSSLSVSGATSLSTLGIGTTAAPLARLQVANGAIMPAPGNTESAGIMFPPNPGGGGSDAAWIRYYPRSGEDTTLEIGTSNDAQDHIALMPSGNVGIGTNAPVTKLHVQGSTYVEGSVSATGWITSPLWNAVQLLKSVGGGLPITRTFSTGGGILVIFASGSGWSTIGGRQIGMNIAVDGVIKGVAKSCTNEPNSHKTFSTVGLVVGGLEAGDHTLALTGIPNTNTDFNDFFNVTFLELPFQKRRIFVPPIIFDPPVILSPQETLADQDE